MDSSCRVLVVTIVLLVVVVALVVLDRSADCRRPLAQGQTLLVQRLLEPGQRVCPHAVEAAQVSNGHASQLSKISVARRSERTRGGSPYAAREHGGRRRWARGARCRWCPDRTSRPMRRPRGLVRCFRAILLDPKPHDPADQVQGERLTEGEADGTFSARIACCLAPHGWIEHVSDARIACADDLF